MVAEPDVARVWVPHENAPGLAMSRSLGDAMVKRYGVSAEPQIVHKEICCDDEYVVLASDGVSVCPDFLCHPRVFYAEPWDSDV